MLGGANEDHRLLIEKKGKAARADRTGAGICQGDHAVAGPEQRVVPDPAGPGEPLEGADSAGRREGQPPAVDCGHGSAAPAATEARQARADRRRKKPADETVILAFVGAAPTVRIEWTPKAEGATGLTALASVQAEQQVWIQEGITRSRTNLAYAISRAELNQLAIEVPADYKVVNVFDPNVRQWSVEPAAPAPRRGSPPNCSSRPRPRSR